MQIAIPKDEKGLATKYYFRLKEKERELGIEQRKNKKLESELEKAERKLRELEDEVSKLKGERDHEKDKAEKYKGMLFKEVNNKESKKIRGAKIGHIGVSRKKPDIEFIQKEVDVKLEKCPHCLSSNIRQRSTYSRIIEDIIINPQLEIIKYMMHQYECRDCKKNIVGIPSNSIGNTPFGKKTFAYILFQKYRLKTPDLKIIEALKEVHGLNISKGGIQNILSSASKQFGGTYDILIDSIREGKFVNADETGWRVNGENWWTWLFSNKQVSLFSIEETRGKGIPMKILGYDCNSNNNRNSNSSSFKGLLGRDGYSGYNKIDTEQQICWVHLLRRAKDYCDRNNSSKEMKDLKKLLKLKYKEMNKFHKKKINKPTTEERLIYHDRIKQYFIDLSKQEWKNKDAQNFIKNWIIKHKDRLVTYLKYEDATGENNQAERALRPFVIFRKITGGSKTKKGAKTTAINMSVIETWAKQGLSIINDIPIFGMKYA